MKRVISIFNILFLLLFQIGCDAMDSQPKEAARTEKTIQLMKAVTLGDTETTKQLLQNGIDANAKDSNGLTVLMVASEKGYTSIVQLLLEKGVELDAQDNKGNTALMKAVKNNHIEIIKMLLSAGADSDPIDKDGNLAYDLIKDRNTEIQSLFQKRNEEIDNYYSAQYKPMNEGVFATDEQAQAYFKSVEKTKKYIEEQKNIRGPLGNTPLLFAVKIGNSYLKDLITASNINMVDPFQKSALMIAVTKNKPEAVKQLIATGADVNYKDRFGQTSLLIAQENGFTEIADLLKSAGAKE